MALFRAIIFAIGNNFTQPYEELYIYSLNDKDNSIFERQIALWMIIGLFFSCSNDDGIDQQTIDMRINHYQNTSMAVGPILTLLVKEGDHIGTDNWTCLKVGDPNTVDLPEMYQLLQIAGIKRTFAENLEK